MSNFGAYWLGALVGLIFAVALGATLSVVSPLPGEAPVESAATPEAAPPAPTASDPAPAEAPRREEPEATTSATEETNENAQDDPAPAETETSAETDAPAETETAAPQPAPAPETPAPTVTAQAEPTPAPSPEAKPEAEAQPAPPPVEETETQAGAETETATEPATPAPAAVNALRDHSERYRGDESQPLLSIVLVDLGDPALNIDEIFLLPAPLTVVIDAEAGNSSALVADARDSGFEALYAVNGAAIDNLDAVLDGAGEIIGVATLAGDVASPEAIATLTNGLTLRQMGLFDASNAGGGAAYRAAQAIDLPAAPAGRRIDENPNSEAVYQALERAAFDARRAGAFVVFARPDPAIMTGLRRWMSLKANRSVAVAPLSTVMRKLGRQ